MRKSILILIMIIIFNAGILYVASSFAQMDIITDTPPVRCTILKLNSGNVPPGISYFEMRKYSGLFTGGVGGAGMGLDLAAKSRANAAYRLGELREGSEETVRSLLELLNDNYTIWVYPPEKKLPRDLTGNIKTTPGERAAEALDKINPDWRNSRLVKETENELLFFLRYGDNKEKESAAHGLGWIKSVNAVKPLIDLIDSPANSLAITAIQALGEIGDKRAFDPLVESLSSWELAKCEAASKALDRIDPKWRDSDSVRAKTDTMLDTLNNKKEGFEGAARALGEIGDKRAVKGLINALKYDTGFSVIDALGKIGDASAVKPLIAIYNEFPNKKLKVVETLGKISDPADSDLMSVAIEEEDRNIRFAAAKVLALRKDERGIDFMIDLLKEDWSIRKLAIEILGDIRDPRAAEPLVEVLKKEREYLTDHAPIIGYEDHPATQTKWLAADALRKIGAPAVKPLLALLTDERIKVRETAATTLRLISTDAQRGVLQFLKEHDFKDDKEKEMIACSLKEIFKNADSQIIEELLDTLKKIGLEKYTVGILEEAGETSIDLLLQIIKGDDPGEARKAIGAINKIIHMTGSKLGTNCGEKDGKCLTVSNAIIDYYEKNGFDKTGLYALSRIGKGNPRILDVFYKALNTKTSMEFWWLENVDLKEKRFIDPLINIIDNHRDSLSRSRALIALSKIDDPRAIEIIISNAFNNTERRLKIAAIEGLGRIGDPLAIDALTKIIKNDESNKDIRRITKKLILFLYNSKDPRAFKIIIDLLDHDDFVVKRETINMLGYLGDKRAVEPLIEALGKVRQVKRNDILYKRIAFSLAKIGAPSIKPLISFIKKNEGSLRKSAEKALMQTRSADAVGPLIDALKTNDDKDVLNVICWTLIKLGEPAAEPLEALLDDPDPNIQDMAAAILLKIGWEFPGAVKEASEKVVTKKESYKTEPGETSLARSIFEMRSDDADTRKAAAVILEKIGEPAIKDLIVLLDNRNREVRKKARETLANIGRAVVEPLITALEDNSILVKQNSAWVLGIIKDKKALEPLLSNLKNENPVFQSYIVFALGNIGDERAAEPLIAIVNNNTSPVRKFAVRALKNIKSPLSVESIIDILDDEDPYILKEAEKALIALTKESFGKDKQKWRSWWEENKEKYLHK